MKQAALFRSRFDQVALHPELLASPPA